MKKLRLNTISSLLLQCVTILCGMILPRVLLSGYGSEVNGLVNSITQFYGFISFLDLGISRTVQSSLYKPLAEKNEHLIDQIVTSASRFFNTIALILLAYILVLIFAFPYLINQNFGFAYTATLLVAMSFSAFAQYYFGVVDRILLISDQKGYIQYTTQAAMLLLNTAASVILIRRGASIQLVKLSTSLIYVLRPFVLRLYVNRHYHVNRHAALQGESIRQKWDGMAQHIAIVVYESTDVVVLSICSTLSLTSVYTVYNLVVHGIKNLFVSLTNGVQVMMGDLWARKENEKLLECFEWTEWLVHLIVVFVFGCTGCLLVPFVAVYTKGVTDVNYIQPLFSLFMTLAGAGYCLRVPYNLMILAAGHYRETQKSYIITAVLNIVISVIGVLFFGLIGVAFGTFAAIVYQIIYLVWYNKKALLKRPIKAFIRLLLMDALIVCASVLLSRQFSLSAITWRAWVILAVKNAVIWFAATLLFVWIFYPSFVKKLFRASVHAVKKLFAPGTLSSETPSAETEDTGDAHELACAPETSLFPRESLSFSIIVLAYKVAPFLEECIQSVLHQTYSDYELILVNPFSDDATDEICARYEREYPQIRRLVVPNRGQLFNRIEGFRAASGNYLLCLDGDDCWEPTLLEEINQIWLRTGSESVIFAFSSFTVHGTYQTVQHVFSPDSLFVGEEGKLPIYDKLIRGGPLNELWAKAFSRNVFLRITEPFDGFEDVRIAEDWLYSFYIVSAAETVTYLDKILYHYRIHSSSIMRTFRCGEIHDRLKIYAMLLRLMEEKKLNTKENLDCFWNGVAFSASNWVFRASTSSLTKEELLDQFNLLTSSPVYEEVRPRMRYMTSNVAIRHALFVRLFLRGRYNLLYKYSRNFLKMRLVYRKLFGSKTF